MLRGNQLDWSEEGMLEKEERWLMNHLNGPLFNDNNNNNKNNNRIMNKKEIMKEK